MPTSPLNSFFPTRPESRPTIYAYADSKFPGMLKVGYTTRPIEERMREHYPTLLPGGAKPYEIKLVESAMYSDGGSFTDRDVHKMLEAKGFSAERTDGKKTEWFACSVGDVQAAIVAVRNHSENSENRTQTFKMRPEQERAVEKTAAYFEKEKRDRPAKSPKFLWNVKRARENGAGAFPTSSLRELAYCSALASKPHLSEPDARQAHKTAVRKFENLLPLFFMERKNAFWQNIRRIRACEKDGA